jgi:hypothetical protein
VFGQQREHGEIRTALRRKHDAYIDAPFYQPLHQFRLESDISPRRNGRVFGWQAGKPVHHGAIPQTDPRADHHAIAELLWQTYILTRAFHRADELAGASWWIVSGRAV